MPDFISYLLFMLIGGTIGAFLGYQVMKRLWSKEDKADRDFMGFIVAAVLAIFGASR